MRIDANCKQSTRYSNEIKTGFNSCIIRKHLNVRPAAVHGRSVGHRQRAPYFLIDCRSQYLNYFRVNRCLRKHNIFCLNHCLLTHFIERSLTAHKRLDKDNSYVVIDDRKTTRKYLL